MPYDNAGYRRHCGECRHFALDEERTKLERDVFGKFTPRVYYCKKLDIFIDHLDSPNNPSSAAEGCYSFDKAGKRQQKKLEVTKNEGATNLRGD